MNRETGWEGILDADETILWQGRPGTRVVWKTSHIIPFVFGMFFAGFALVWMIMASSAPGPFWMFGLIHFCVGIGLAVGPQFYSAWRRRHTWYTLTNQRAFIATDSPLEDRSLKSYVINAETKLEFESGIPASIYFDHEYRSGKNGARKIPIGFERIQDGEKVYRMLRNVQKDAT